MCVYVPNTYVSLIESDTLQLLGLFSTIRNCPCEADFRASPCGTAILKPLSAVDHFNDNNNS